MLSNETMKATSEDFKFFIETILKKWGLKNESLQRNNINRFWVLERCKM